MLLIMGLTSFPVFSFAFFAVLVSELCFIEITFCLFRKDCIYVD